MSLIGVFEDLDLDEAVLRSAAEHVSFPPKLPQAALDRGSEVAVESAICALAAATSRFYAECALEQRPMWIRLANAIDHLGRSFSVPIHKDGVFNAIRQMKELDVMALHVREQNAAIIIRKQPFTTTFEVFEVYPPTSAVLASPSRLVRSFPGSAVEVDESTMRENGFLEQVASMLSKLDIEVMEGSMATSKKGGTQHRETREAADPRFVSELFLGILLGYGRRVAVRGVKKRIGDDVLWKSALRPWRRSPAWLICRVLLQTTIPDIAHYKSFMIYLHANVLAYCSQRGLDAELLFHMQTKAARRLDKLREVETPSWVKLSVSAAVHRTQDVLRSWWQERQAECEALRTPVWTPGTLDFDADIKQSLTTSHRHLQDIMSQRTTARAPYITDPPTPPRIRSSDFRHYAHEKLKQAVSETDRVALADFEGAVRKYLDTWVHQQGRFQGTHVANACDVLSSCFLQYDEIARKTYARDPTDLSIYALTILELWVGIDRLAVISIPLLARYSPEIMATYLHPLLLRSNEEIERANYLESYIRRRHSAADIKTSIFTDRTDITCFAVKYFQSSYALQQLKRDIETDAHQARRRKIAELEKMNAQYEALHAQSLDMDHEDFWSQKKRRLVHNFAGKCQRCKIENAAGKLKIQVHEWPLPTDARQAEATVFELRLPPTFAIWRSVTFAILAPIGTPKWEAHGDPFVVLPRYDQLASRYGQFHSSARVTVGSETKSVLQSHYSQVQAPATESSVCVGNGLKFRLYDSIGSSWAFGPFSDFSMTQYGTLLLPTSSPYRYLAYGLEGTEHSTNQVIADRSSCPKDLSLQEHDAFGSLRSGGRLQWLNVLRELEAGSLTLRNEEVYTLLTQAAWQVGPSAEDGPGREWHEDVENPSFRRRLYEVCSSILSNVRANWREAVTVRGIVDLTLRGLTASASDFNGSSKQPAYECLRQARVVAFSWLQDIKALLLADEELEKDDDYTPYRHLACELALLCRKTYDVGYDDLPELLRDHKDVRILIDCSITVWENQPSSPSQTPSHLAIMLSRDVRLAHRLQEPLVARLLTSWAGLTSAVLGVWPDFVAGSSKGVCMGGLWLFLQTAPRAGRTSQRVHYNVLSGQLLVNGKPLGRLPQAVTSHSFYMRTFGKRMFDVVPADTAGMEYATRTRIKGEYQMSFAVVDRRLRIQARTAHACWELVPHETFRHDVPRALAEDCAHWINLGSHELEFRPLQDQWRSSCSNWKIALDDRVLQAVRLLNGEESEYLVNYRARSFKMLTQRLSGLEDPSFMQVVYAPQTRTAYVTLPRLRLRFTLSASSNLESDDLPAMIVDESQVLGTFIGLRNQLVLRHKNRTLRHQRCVLIPYGDVQITRREEAGHVQVSIDTSDCAHVPYQKYDIQEDLARVTTHASLTSRLYKIYLHAVTSSCVPDPLTGQTGVEQALVDLVAAASYSSAALQEQDVQLLSLIGSLTPVRNFYPSHLRCMQTVQWSPISTFAQHSSFAGIVESIVQHSNSLRIFHDSDTVDLNDCVTNLRREPHLLQRAMTRSRRMYPSGMIASNDQTSLVRDDIYVSRDMEGSHSDQLRAATWAVRLAQSRNAHVKYELVDHIIRSCKTIDDPDSELQLGYSVDWLSLPSSCWLAIYDVARQSGRFGRAGYYRLTFSLATLSYGSPQLRCLIPICIASTCNRRLHEEAPPPWVSYELEHGFDRQLDTVVSIIVNQFALPLPKTPAESLERGNKESMVKYKQRKIALYNSEVQSHASRLAARLLGENSPSYHEDMDGDYSSWVDARGSVKVVAEYFTHCAHNTDLRSHLARVETVLRRKEPTTEPQLIQYDAFKTRDLVDVIVPEECTMPVYHGIPDLINRLALVNLAWPDVFLSPASCPPTAARGEVAHSDTVFADLAALVDELRFDQGDGVGRVYGNDLMESLKDAQRRVMTERDVVGIPPCTILALNGLHVETEHAWRSRLAWLQSQLHVRSSTGGQVEEDLLGVCGLLPRMTLPYMLRALSYHQRRRSAIEQRRFIIHLAQRFILHQHATRLWTLAILDHQEELNVEWSNWRVEFADEQEDDLLLQIDGNFRIRSHQIEVAREMIHPSSRSSAVFQVNMGEGKTSVITPMIVCALADGLSFVRVIVLKALSAQMQNLLVTRLGGLINRRVYYLPFSRNVDVSQNGRVKAIEELFKECTREGGVLLAQPEHILSLKLMSVDMSMSVHDGTEVCSQMEHLQRWLRGHSRDVLDESDELLSVSYQLIYTSGSQRPIDFHPDRWIIVQQMLGLVAKLAPALHVKHPSEVEFTPTSPGRFPAFRLLRTPFHDNAYSDLKHMVASAILGGDMPALNLSHITEEDEQASMIAFFTQRDVNEQMIEDVKTLCEGNWKGVLLVRGLVAYDVLHHVLRDKRYRVNYGLDLSRSLLAVPYAAKDIPTPRAEFSHPDVALALTAISYYIAGLTENQLLLAFNALLHADDPNIEYHSWVEQDPTLPQHLKRLNGINTKDIRQFNEQVYPAFSHNQSTVDFFLAQLVFPKDAREFPSKLSSSGWDLVGNKTHVTTGFSGTNDRRHLLPTSIEQRELAQQSGTSALVLQALLRPENNHYHCMVDSEGRSLGTRHFLDLLLRQEPQIRVLLDVGAQMLDLQNQELVAYWLSLRPKGVSAAVFFNERDELTVLSADGSVQPLESSPYQQSMDRVVVYLDDAHTRGTDLKLPRDTRAAVTLGPKVTKDRLVQGCMRMRRLGNGQSVVFFAPLECDTYIRAAISPTDRPNATPVQAKDILRWVMKETCGDIRHYVPHWAQQGLEYLRRSQGEKNFELNGNTMILRQAWLTTEGRKLEDMYGTRDFNRDLMVAASKQPTLRDRLRQLGITNLDDPQLDEEQEREISHEVERQRQVERPAKMEPAIPSIDTSLKAFITSGVLDSLTRMRKLMSPIRVPDGEHPPWSSNLFATADFFAPVISSVRANTTTYGRPVWWILSSKRSNILIVASPYEINSLLPLIRRSQAVHLHIYTPKVVQGMRSFSDLQFYAVPPLSVDWTPPSLGSRSQLNLFAGQLYFDSYQEYFELCAFLGVASPESFRLYQRERVPRRSDGFVWPRHRPNNPTLQAALSDFGGRSFYFSVVYHLKVHVSLRRGGMDFARTHIGRLLHGRQLTMDDFGNNDATKLQVANDDQ